MAFYKAKQYKFSGSETLLIVTKLETEFEVLEVLRATNPDMSSIEVQTIAVVDDISTREITDIHKIDRVVLL